MSLTFAFDIYGTLIDTKDVSSLLQQYLGEQANAFSNQWREKQLEYSFRRGLMKQYQRFDVCTKDALDFTDTMFASKLTSEQKQALLNRYTSLAAFPSVSDCLRDLQKEQVKLYAFSNGPASSVQRLLDNAGLSTYFVDIVSTDEIQSFKPNPAVYHHFLERAGSAANETWLISSNSFDVLGAKAAGLKSAWLQRDSSTVLDPWDITPDLTISDLDGLFGLINKKP